ncbi:uncharacterized protein LOC128296751 [Anopheles moucheti]|uniref:uncharacterized protein LOC128296751 n=1 Tax=Anopheles moucheti TaxID=186751 RepID=UPI0022F04912|nr:uncharacterized protein LOC128296751 [Anopheles moucheti]
MTHNTLSKQQQISSNGEGSANGIHIIEDAAQNRMELQTSWHTKISNTSSFIVFSKFLGEFFGTATLMFLGCMGCLDGFDNITSNFSRGLIFGFTVMVVILTFGVVSGAHINPVVSIAAYIYGDLSCMMVLVYFVAQFAGALCGYGLLMGVAPQTYFDLALVDGHGTCVTAPHASLTTSAALGIEFIVTGILIWACCGVWDPRNAKYQDSVPLKFALLVASISVAAGPATGASMNPARTLAPCVWNNSYHKIWIYFVGPPLAGIIMPITYKYIFRREIHGDDELQIKSPQGCVCVVHNKESGINSTMKKSTLDNISVFLAELIGTGLLVMLGCMGCVSGLGHTPSHFELCINFGLIVMIVVQVFGCVSGAHLNPAVTAAAWVYELVSTKMALAYGVAQCIGAFMGYGILKLLTPGDVFETALAHGAGFCVTQPNSAISNMQAVGIEFVATMVLILVCCGVWDPRNAKHHDSVALKFGFTVGALAVAAGPYTGASMNPARSVGPVLWNGVYNAHWIYWVGPLGAAFLTAFAYKAVFRREVPIEQLNHELAALNTDKSNA